MKKMLIIATLAAFVVMTSGCAQHKTIDNTTYSTYGIFDESTARNPNIEYEISGWSVFWSIILCETIIVPILIIGFDLWQPVSKKNDPNHIPGKIGG